jgi:cyanate permease
VTEVVPPKGSIQLADEAKAAKQVIVDLTAQMWKRVALMLAAVLLAVLVLFVWQLQIARNTNATVTTIRNVQKTNTMRSDCQLVAFNGIIKDIPLAFSGDKNPNDYSKVHQCK